MLYESWSLEINDQKIQQARQFLRDYIGSNQDQIKSWLDGASRENFGAELILLSLEARKIVDAYDLSGIALGSAMSLFKTVEGGVLAAQKVVAYLYVSQPVLLSYAGSLVFPHSAS